MSRRGFIDHGKQAVYFWSPKCACTTLFRSLTRTYGQNNTHYHRSSAPFKDCSRIIQSEGYTSAVIVRDPFKRIVSAYVNKFVRKGDQSLAEHEALTPSAKRLLRQRANLLGGSQTNNDLSFVDFLRVIEMLFARRKNANENSLDGHWDTQIPPGARDFEYDHVVRVENLSEEFEALCRRYGLVYRGDVANKTQYGSPASEFYGNEPAASLAARELSSDNFRDRWTEAAVDRLYRLDAEKFGYDLVAPQP